MTTILQFLIQSIPIFVSIAVPGALLSLAILRKTKLCLFEIFFVGIVLGISVPSLMAFSEFLIGIPFSLELHLVNMALVCLFSIGVIIKDKLAIFPKTLDIKILYAFVALTVILFLAWWIRQQSLNPYFYEFDPYWYNTITESIIKDGGVPVSVDNAWWPQFYSYRSVSLISYAEAGWYCIYALTNGITSFDFNTMTLVSSLYPAMAAALMCFFAYLWLSKEYGKVIGILAAGFLAFTPILVDKMLAGEFEMQPWGLFAMVFFLAFYTLTLKTGSRRFALITAFAIIIGVLGSNAGRLPIYLVVGISSILGIVKFIRNELDLNFMYLNLIIALGMFIGLGLNVIYISPAYGILGVSLLVIAVGFLVFNGALFYLQSVSKSLEEKLFYVSSIFVVALVLAFVTPLSSGLSEITGLFSGVVTYTDPTFQTIAEQTVSGSSLHSALGIFGIDISGSILGFDISEFSIVPLVISIATGILAFFLVSKKKDLSPNMNALHYMCAILIALTTYLLLITPPTNILFIICMVIDVICAILILAFIGPVNSYVLLNIIGVAPLSVTGLFKVKYTVYSGLFVPLMVCFAIGEICNNKKVERYRGYILILFSVILVSQAINYADVLLSSVGAASSLDITNNSAAAAFCNAKYQEMVNITDNNSTLFKDNILSAKSMTQRVYCNRIPDHWLNAMYWLKNNTLIDDRTICWWDYGHWITTFGQRKSVTDNLHAYTVMHQEVADKLVYNTPEALIDYMTEHKAKYLLLDQDLIAKWGALVYHACYYNNKTKIEIGPGGSDCDKEYSPEFIFIPTESSSNNLCSDLNGKKRVRVYSPYFGSKNQFDYYCGSFDSLNEELQLLQYGTNYIPLSLTYENGKPVGITKGMFQGNNNGYLVFLATYPSNSSDKKGKFYDSVFYKGFFEGKVPGFEQVHPNSVADGPNIPVRIFKLK